MKRLADRPRRARPSRVPTLGLVAAVLLYLAGYSTMAGPLG